MGANAIIFTLSLSWFLFWLRIHKPGEFVFFYFIRCHHYKHSFSIFQKSCAAQVDIYVFSWNNYNHTFPLSVTNHIFIMAWYCVLLRKNVGRMIMVNLALQRSCFSTITTSSFSLRLFRWMVHILRIQIIPPKNGCFQKKKMDSSQLLHTFLDYKNEICLVFGKLTKKKQLCPEVPTSNVDRE